MDIDADVIYTELAPSDALVQRMGRILRRHNREFVYDSEPNVKIIFFEEGLESGNSRVYSKEILLTSLSILISILIDKKDVNEEEILNNLQNYIKYKNNKFIVDSKLENTIKKYDQSKNDKKNNKESIKFEDCVLLSEYDKYVLNNSLYKSQSSESSFKRDFFKTLDLLDAGYISDSRLEAQQIFRSMATTLVIPEIRLEQFKQSVKEFFNKYRDSERIYTFFKHQIIAKFFVNIIGLKQRNPIYKLEYWIESNFADVIDDNLTKDEIEKL